MTLTFESLQPREREGMSFYLRLIGGDWYFRVNPIRAPEQPRLWRLLVEACDSPSLIQPELRYAPFLTSGIIDRSDLTGRLAEIREKPMVWVRQKENRDLLRWLEAVAATPVPKKPMSARVESQKDTPRPRGAGQQDDDGAES
jgi:hypothetical protein